MQPIASQSPQFAAEQDGDFPAYEEPSEPSPAAAAGRGFVSNSHDDFVAQGSPLPKQAQSQLEQHQSPQFTAAGTSSANLNSPLEAPRDADGNLQLAQLIGTANASPAPSNSAAAAGGVSPLPAGASPPVGKTPHRKPRVVNPWSNV